MKTLEEVLDWLDTQLLKHQSLVLLTREDASTLSQACQFCQPDPAATARAARAWDEGGDFVSRHPGMSAEYVRAANPYRQPEGNRA